MAGVISALAQYGEQSEGLAAWRLASAAHHGWCRWRRPVAGGGGGGANIGASGSICYWLVTASSPGSVSATAGDLFSNSAGGWRAARKAQ